MEADSREKKSVIKTPCIHNSLAEDRYRYRYRIRSSPLFGGTESADKTGHGLYHATIQYKDK